MSSYIYRARRPIRDLRRQPEPQPAAPVPSTPDYSAMLKADLVALATDNGVDASGTKADIIARLPHG